MLLVVYVQINGYIHIVVQLKNLTLLPLCLCEFRRLKQSDGWHSFFQRHFPVITMTTDDGISRRRQTDVKYLDFCRVFGIVPHHIFSSKLERYGFKGWTVIPSIYFKRKFHCLEQMRVNMNKYSEFVFQTFKRLHSTSGH